LGALGDIPAAIQKLHEAQELLSNNEDPSIGEGHWLRVVVLRNLGVYYWEMAEALRSGIDLDRATKEKIRAFNLQAYDVTRPAFDIRVRTTDPMCDQYDRETNYLGRIANNLLYYITDFLDAGGTVEELAKHGYRPIDSERYVQLLEKHLHLIDSPATLHTILRHYQRTNDRTNAELVARKLVKNLHERGVTEPAGKSHEGEMLRLGMAVLGKQD